MPLRYDSILLEPLNIDELADFVNEEYNYNNYFKNVCNPNNGFRTLSYYAPVNHFIEFTENSEDLDRVVSYNFSIFPYELSQINKHEIITKVVNN